MVRAGAKASRGATSKDWMEARAREGAGVSGSWSGSTSSAVMDDIDSLMGDIGSSF